MKLKTVRTSWWCAALFLFPRHNCHSHETSWDRNSVCEKKTTGQSREFPPTCTSTILWGCDIAVHVAPRRTTTWPSPNCHFSRALHFPTLVVAGRGERKKWPLEIKLDKEEKKWAITWKLFWENGCDWLLILQIKKNLPTHEKKNCGKSLAFFFSQSLRLLLLLSPLLQL